MKYSNVIVLAFAGVALGQISNLPECAQGPIGDAVTSATSCSLDDQACQCETANKAAIQGAATSAVLASCGADAALEVLAAANAACENLPEETETTSSAEEETTSSAAPTTSSVVETTTTSVEATTTSTIVETLTSASVSASPTPSANGTVTGTPTPTPSEFPGAATKVGAGFASFVALGLAALAAF